MSRQAGIFAAPLAVAFFLLGCEPSPTAGIVLDAEPHQAQYANTTRRVDYDNDEWYLYDILNAYGASFELRSGVTFPCTTGPFTLQIPRRPATEIQQPLGTWFIVSRDLDQRAARDSVGPYTITIPAGARQRISIWERWESYYADIAAYHMKQQGGQVLVVETARWQAARFWHLRWEATRQTCHQQGGG